MIVLVILIDRQGERTRSGIRTQSGQTGRKTRNAAWLMLSMADKTGSGVAAKARGAVTGKIGFLV